MKLIACAYLTAIRILNRLVNEECRQWIAQSGQPPIHNQLVQQWNLVTIKHQATDLIEVVGVEEVASTGSWDDELQRLIRKSLRISMALVITFEYLMSVQGVPSSLTTWSGERIANEIRAPADMIQMKAIYVLSLTVSASSRCGGIGGHDSALSRPKKSLHNAEQSTNDESKSLVMVVIVLEERASIKDISGAAHGKGNLRSKDVVNITTKDSEDQKARVHSRVSIIRCHSIDLPATSHAGTTEA
ncbi:hypothetical protein V6N12_022584 [Hibiscus sabdariffa]|uniref:Uncharacterized protein n=1 Tax=Hibiscus sabdariffa TaxID=183260 RepID=A0ABR2FVB8_9ROSI